jgi:PAS domain S-box-containing protein
LAEERRTRVELIAEIEDLEKRIAMLEASQEAGLRHDLETARGENANLHDLLGQATDLICELAADGTLLYVSPNAEAVLGVPADALIGRSVLDTMLMRDLHPEDRGQLDAYLEERMARSDASEAIHRYRVRGQWRSFACRGRAIRDPDGSLRSVIFARDVTDREEALQQLRQSEARYRLVTEATHDLVAEVDAEGRVVFVSASSREVLGLRPEEMVGTTPFSLLHPDDVEHLAELFLGRVQSDRGPGRGAVFRIRHRDGSWRWLEGTGIAFETAGGEKHLVAVTRDVTERIEAERAQRRLVRRVEQARRFESLGMLATGMAHDFNNLLTPILGAAGLALMDLPPDSPARARLERIQRASAEAAALTNQLLEYAGMGGLDAAPVRLPTVVDGVEETLQASVGSQAVLRVEHAPDAPRIEADATLLGQLAIQLVDNAIGAIEESGIVPGCVTVRTGNGFLDEEALARMTVGEEASPALYACLEVADDGGGMDDATRARAFDPFFTTRATGRGLGLSVVLGIVRKHRGALEFETEKGAGTRVRAWLPVASS